MVSTRCGLHASILAMDSIRYRLRGSTPSSRYIFPCRQRYSYVRRPRQNVCHLHFVDSAVSKSWTAVLGRWCRASVFGGALFFLPPLVCDHWAPFSPRFRLMHMIRCGPIIQLENRRLDAQQHFRTILRFVCLSHETGCKKHLPHSSESVYNDILGCVGAFFREPAICFPSKTCSYLPVGVKTIVSILPGCLAVVNCASAPVMAVRAMTLIRTRR